MMMYARTVTVRDRQLEEKKCLEEERRKEEKRKDLMMELERLKTIRYLEEIERQKREDLKKGHQIIVEQIKEREIARMKQREEEEKEGQAMISLMKQIQKEDSELNLRKKAVAKKNLDDIYEANKNAIKSKEQRAFIEKEEEERIVHYNIEKARKEAEYANEQRRIKEEKEREVQRLREMQEKANDRQAEIDAIRARRAWEENERNAREKERREAEIRIIGEEPERTE
eukprot:TRINITY_DN4714_c0_g2_i1.p2 TRINITY_DN4714_c0_g2~~TRINITY_DN4714_c0_g2_i1.p2  ORF type:complete len:228 (+),score=74.06 TRINITY_DN4714_c0_g2_i1:649-1332(+)